MASDTDRETRPGSRSGDPLTGLSVLHSFYPAHSSTITPPTRILLGFSRLVPSRIERFSALRSSRRTYFFEWCVWIGFAIYGLAFAPAGLLALLGQAIILTSILGVTGIPPTENQALRSKGEAYRAYQARVSRFIPVPPKR